MIEFLGCDRNTVIARVNGRVRRMSWAEYRRLDDQAWQWVCEDLAARS